MTTSNPHGCFERIADGCVSGWLTGEKGDPLPVIVQVNGVAAATVKPRRTWPWTRRAGNSQRGRFEVRLRLAPGDRVVVLNGTTGQPLPGGVRQVVDPHWRPRVGLVAPAKEEAPYLLEWIAYHRALGIESIVIGDNGGADHTSELLQALAAAGAIQRLDWRGQSAFQISFDMEAIRRLCGVTDVCSVTDVDEFIRPLGGRSDIPTAVAEIFARKEVSAAGLSWVTYGSSGRIEPGEGLVIERFTQRAADDHIRHCVVKTILRPERIVGMVNPHVATIASGEYVNDRGDPIRWTSVPAMAEFASWNSLRVDHFVVKSRREFATKAKRGLADQPAGIRTRDEAFFASRDCNEVFDPMPADFVDRTKDELARLRDRLKRFIPLDSPLQTLMRD
ncbi:MAG: glycosyltransferase family 2 protein [Rhizobiales bacterium]|nr:glycosyltransferase family 2 protein [Hyphomicrobiales bacterium]